MDKKVIEIGNKIFEIQINFKKSYQLTKYRNKMAYGIDFGDADKHIIEEIAKIQLEASNGEEIDMSALSPDTVAYLTKKSTRSEEIFDYDELIDMGMILTGIESKEELEKLYDIEVEANGYDSLIAKLTLGVSTVFMNAKDTSKAQEESK